MTWIHTIYGTKVNDFDLKEIVRIVTDNPGEDPAENFRQEIFKVGSNTQSHVDAVFDPTPLLYNEHR